MRHVVRMVVAIRFALSTRRDLLLEILALRHQLRVLVRSNRRVRPSDRLLWLVLRQLWPRWRDALVLVQPGHGRPLASRGVPSMLAPPLATCWQTTHRFRMSRLDSALGRRKRSLGRSANPRRVTQARDRRLRTHRVAAPARPAEGTVTDVADIPRESPRPVHVLFARDVTIRARR